MSLSDGRGAGTDGDVRVVGLGRVDGPAAAGRLGGAVALGRAELSSRCRMSLSDGRGAGVEGAERVVGLGRNAGLAAGVDRVVGDGDTRGVDGRDKVGRLDGRGMDIDGVLREGAGREGIARDGAGRADRLTEGLGLGRLTGGRERLIEGIERLTDGRDRLIDGLGRLADGRDRLIDGLGRLTDGREADDARPSDELPGRWPSAVPGVQKAPSSAAIADAASHVRMGFAVR